ncbi:hypothetical protein, partial [Polymorphobacter multimanifer]|uniref:hypothetical protein n=1 Tax=Polymorphobacter multimanifer TaxID=1070431 RepID=UPI001664C0DD
MITGLIDWLSASGISAWAGGGGVYPTANVLHLLGLVLLLGSIGIVDLRIMGAFRALPADAVSRALTPLGVVGLVILVLGGATLFAADAASVAASMVFRWKLVTIVLALANAAAFRWWLRPGSAPIGLRRQ